MRAEGALGMISSESSAQKADASQVHLGLLLDLLGRFLPQPPVLLLALQE